MFGKGELMQQLRCQQPKRIPECLLVCQLPEGLPIDLGLQGRGRSAERHYVHNIVHRYLGDQGKGDVSHDNGIVGSSVCSDNGA